MFYLVLLMIWVYLVSKLYNDGDKWLLNNGKEFE